MSSISSAPPRGNIKNIDSEQGVTLIVSVVLLAAVTFISFSLSTIILREIQAGRLTLASEPALSGANSGGEVGLYRLFREAGGTAASGLVGSSSVSYQVTTNLYVNTYNFSVTPGTDTKVLLYDAENPDNTAANYGSATIANNPTSGTAIDYRIFSWSDVVNPVCVGTIGVGLSSPACALNSADDRYLIIIDTVSNNPASGTVQATDNTGAPRGIPSDNPELDVTGTNGNAQRKIQITL